MTERLLDALTHPSFREKHGITEWCNGRDPESFGYVFEGGRGLTADAISRCEDRDALEDAGVPEAVLDALYSAPWG